MTAQVIIGFRTDEREVECCGTSSKTACLDFKTDCRKSFYKKLPKDAFLAEKRELEAKNETVNNINKVILSSTN